MIGSSIRRVKPARRLAHSVSGRKIGAGMRCSGYTAGNTKSGLPGSRRAGSNRVHSMPGVSRPERRKRSVKLGKFPSRIFWRGSVTHKVNTQGGTRDRFRPACSLFTVEQFLTVC